MTDLLPFIILGAISGAVYGLAGVGFVLTYKTSGILNFAHGAIAAIAAFAFYFMNVQHGWPWPVAAAICVFVLGPIVGLIFERLASAVSGASLAMQVTSTVGVLLVINAATLLLYPNSIGTLNVPVFLAKGGFQFEGAFVPWAGVITFAVALLATAGLYIFFRSSRQGKAMRAIVDSPELLDLSGTNSTGVRRSAWIIGITFATASGVLFASLVPLDAITLTFLVVQAFGAAAIGGFTSLPLTFAGGLVLGIGSSLLTKWFLSGALVGLAPSLPFIVLFVLLLVLPKRFLVERSAPLAVRPRSNWTAPWQVQIGGGSIALLALILVPTFASYHLADWTLAIATVVIFLSLSLLVRTSGQVSLCHIAFAAIGAAAFSHLAVDQGWPWLLALFAAGLVAVPVGVVLAIPAMRLSGLYLALATFGFGVLLSYLFYPADYMFGVSGAGLPMPRPHLSFIDIDSDKGLYYVMLAFAAGISAFILALNRSRLGRLLRAMSDSPIALSTTGTSVNVTRILVFCLSAFLAALGGALAGVASSVASASSYSPITSLVYLVVIMITVGATPWNAVLAGLTLIVPPSYITSTQTSNWLQLFFGFGAIMVAIHGTPGVPLKLQAAIDRLFGRTKSAEAAAAAAAAEPLPDTDAVLVEREAVPESLLEVKELTVRFGGLVAVNDASLEAPTGRITGLIGPNGAGKTTTFNACSGIVRPSAGKVVLDGRDITSRTPASRARLGLARTFQQTQLFDSLTVWENVALGRESGMAGGNPARHIAATPAERRLIDSAAAEAIELCGLTSLAHVAATKLSTGQRRLVELARSLAGPSQILLLDEPSAGLDRAETAKFATILRRVVEERGVGILLVEHDMSLVMEVCDYIYVLDFGKMIFEGDAEQVRGSKIVQAAYLGGDEVEEVVADADVDPEGEAETVTVDR
ncbi:MAG TPA: branched-chain amino acid ABC transporter permease/ATP-binding protein [Solirubrobacteraceae bacterium]|nr:branched-chain amino acid ABC transporter permease/ATP-binding protein [Solirubrobacteraceae bacterium]